VEKWSLKVPGTRRLFLFHNNVSQLKKHGTSYMYRGYHALFTVKETIEFSHVVNSTKWVYPRLAPAPSPSEVK
jgi:hypothetical protein